MHVSSRDMFPATRNPCTCLPSSPLLWRLINFRLFCSDDCRSWPREERFWSDDFRSWPREEKINNQGCWGTEARTYSWQWLLRNLSVSCRVRPIFLCAIILMWYTRNIYIYFFFFINWTLRMSNNLPERVQILGHAHILCITIWEQRIICCQIFYDLLLNSAFERIFKVMQLILVKIK